MMPVVGQPATGCGKCDGGGPPPPGEAQQAYRHSSGTPACRACPVDSATILSPSCGDAPAPKLPSRPTCFDAALVEPSAATYFADTSPHPSSAAVLHTSSARAACTGS